MDTTQLTHAFNQRATLITGSGASLTQRQRDRPRSAPPAVQPWVFRAERQRAFDPQTPSGLVLLDRSEHLNLEGPGTTPSLLAAYLKVRSGAEVSTDFQGSLEVYYVIHGAGHSTWGDNTLHWQAGDVFFLPGGNSVYHQATAGDSLLYVLSDEPLARFLGLRPAQGKFEPTHYLARDIQAAQTALIEQTQDSGVIHFGRDAGVVYSSFLPTWKWIVPGEHQAPHRHAAVAIQLLIAGQHSYSIINGNRLEWEDFTVVISPAGSLHSHHNEGSDLGIYLVTQDFPLYRYLRTYWHEQPDPYFCLQDW